MGHVHATLLERPHPVECEVRIRLGECLADRSDQRAQVALATQRDAHEALCLLRDRHVHRRDVPAPVIVRNIGHDANDRHPPNRRILKLIMRTSGVQVLIGVGIGMLLLPVMGSGLGNVLNGVSPYDPGIYLLVVVLMLMVAVAATLTPTRRALRVDPAAALRYE